MKILLFLLGLWILPVMAQNFLPGTEDIPLMDGLTQVEETASFDNPSERMVLISAQTSLPPKKVQAFYSQSLKNLGWTEVKPNVFERGSDSFSLEILKQGKMFQLQFRLSERNL